MPAPSPAPAPARRTRDGLRVARLFRQVRVPGHLRDVRRCDLDAILEEDELEVCESEVAECGYAACLIRMPEGGGGIMIAAGQELGRRRFSLAHELGHFHIPSHKHVGVLLPEVGHALHCADADMRVRSTDARRIEWEANDFATEVLMPFAQFSADVDRHDATFRGVATLAAPDMYDVSLTAAALRVVETTREPCALVVSVGGQVEWVVRSRAWRYPLAERRRPVPRGSAAEAVARGEQANPDAENVDPGVWLAGTDGRGGTPPAVTLSESTHAVPRLGQVLSLLWVAETG